MNYNKHVGVPLVGTREQPTKSLSKGQAQEIAPTHKHNRRSIRLLHYDYSRAGYYFVTITAQNREHLFGEICDGEMVLNVAGEMVQRLWYDITNDFPNVALHDFVIMPNHIHGIIQIVGVSLMGTLDTDVDKQINCNGITIQGNHKGLPQRLPQRDKAVGNIIGAFKSKTTNTYIKMVQNNILPPFNKHIWQRNYYEHVVRDDVDYERIAAYIQNNVMTWELDSLNKP